MDSVMDSDGISAVIRVTSIEHATLHSGKNHQCQYIEQSVPARRNAGQRVRCPLKEVWQL